MATEYATITGECPNCPSGFVIENVWEAGGVNDRGGFILECSSCTHIFDVHVGRDVNSSSVQSGAKLLARYDTDIEGDRERTLKTYGLT